MVTMFCMYRPTMTPCSRRSPPKGGPPTASASRAATDGVRPGTHPQNKQGQSYSSARSSRRQSRRAPMTTSSTSIPSGGNEQRAVEVRAGTSPQDFQQAQKPTEGSQFLQIVAKRTKRRNPTSPHWYDESRLQRYVAAHVARDRELKRERTVREFVAEFRGLSGTAVQRNVLAETGCSHQSLTQFFGVERVNYAGIKKLLAAMQEYSNPVAPKHLGIIGREHFKTRFLAAGGNIETFKYELEKGFTEDGIPFVIELAFGLHQSGLTPQAGHVTRKFISGVNWSVGIDNPFRTFGRTGQGLENMLAELRVNAREPVICAVHLASAHVQYRDRGKSSIVLSGDNAGAE